MFFYVKNATLVGFSYGDHDYFYTKNAQGDVTGIVDGSCKLIVEYSYDAWGKLLSTTGELADTIGKINPFLYRGYYYDSETGLYYLNSRYYDPQTGRFINAYSQLNAGLDLTSYNLFTYCGNNPVNYADSNGTMPFLVITALVVAVVGAVVGGVIAANSGGNVLAGIGIGAAGGALLGLGIGAGIGMISGAGALATAGEIAAGVGTGAATAEQALEATAAKAENTASEATKVVSESSKTLSQLAEKASTTGSMADTIGARNPLLYRGYYDDFETFLIILSQRPKVGSGCSPLYESWGLFGVYPYKNRLLTTNAGKIETVRNRITPPFVDVHCIVLKSNFRFQVLSPAPNHHSKSDTMLATLKKVALLFLWLFCWDFRTLSPKMVISSAASILLFRCRLQSFLLIFAHL